MTESTHIETIGQKATAGHIARGRKGKLINYAFDYPERSFMVM